MKQPDTFDQALLALRHQIELMARWGWRGFDCSERENFLGAGLKKYCPLNSPDCYRKSVPVRLESLKVVK